MAVWNVFRVLGDLTHLFSKLVLLWSIHSNRSAEGVSLITQVLYAIVFITRYLSPPFTHFFDSAWNVIFKIFYISSSLYIVFIMLKVFARSRERETAWKFGAACLGGSAILAPFVMLIFSKKNKWGFGTTMWSFSEVLESVCVLPQLILLRETSVPTVIDTFYLLMLGSYRAFYILNWIWRGAMEEGYSDPTSWIFGTIQVLFYLDFAWVYFGRQRVKLRNGTVVDGDDISRGYLVGKVLGRASGEGNGDDDDEEVGTGRGWAGRGISVSADEGITDARPQPENAHAAKPKYTDAAGSEAERSSMMHGDSEELDFEDVDDDAADTDVKSKTPEGVSGGEEWRSEEEHH